MTELGEVHIARVYPLIWFGEDMRTKPPFSVPGNLKIELKRAGAQRPGIVSIALVVRVMLQEDFSFPFHNALE